MTDFVSAMAAAVTGVCVVTTDGARGRLGLTVGSMASVSADPPMLLVCVNRRSPLAAAIRGHGVFAVSALGAHQAEVAETFAGRPAAGAPYDFACARWRSAVTGAPLVEDAAAWFDCSVDSAVEAGTHTVLIGAVLAAGRGIARPLAYTRRAYAEPRAISGPARRRRLTAAAR